MLEDGGEPRGGEMSSEIVGPIERASERDRVERRATRELAIESLGPLTILGGVVWAIFQPYRIVFFNSSNHGFYEYIVQGPLLVIGVGVFFALVVAPGLVEDLRSGRDAES
jgi:hypothetical protein